MIVRSCCSTATRKRRSYVYYCIDLRAVVTSVARKVWVRLGQPACTPPSAKSGSMVRSMSGLSALQWQPDRLILCKFGDALHQHLRHEPHSRHVLLFTADSTNPKSRKDVTRSHLVASTAGIYISSIHLLLLFPSPGASRR